MSKSEIENIEEQVIDQEVETESNPLEELGDTNFFDLPYEEREQLKVKIKASLPEEKQRAMELGWTPKEMFRGKYKDGTDKPWVDAEEFLERIEKEAPVRNERIRSVTQERDSYKEEISKLQAQMKKMLEINKSKIERDLLNEESSMDKELADAKEDYDWDRYERLKERKSSLEREKLKLKEYEEPPVAPQEPELQPEVQDWVRKNPWIVSDNRLVQFAKAKEQELLITSPELSLRERLEIVAEKTADQFPSQAPQTPRRTYQPARNGGNFGDKPKSKTFDDLPELDKAQALSLIKKGVWSSKAEFLKTYEW